MAQLTDDCFAFGGPLLSIDDAIALMWERLPVLAGVETVPLLDADGRIAAADVTAGIDLPPFDNSAVDGYALRHADLTGDKDADDAAYEALRDAGGTVAEADVPPFALAYVSRDAGPRAFAEGGSFEITAPYVQDD